MIKIVDGRRQLWFVAQGRSGDGYYQCVAEWVGNQLRIHDRIIAPDHIRDLLAFVEAGPAPAKKQYRITRTFDFKPSEVSSGSMYSPGTYGREIQLLGEGDIEEV